MTVIGRMTHRIAAAIDGGCGAYMVGRYHPDGTQHVARIVAEALADDHQGAVEALRRVRQALGADTMRDPRDTARRSMLAHEYAAAWLDAHDGGQ